MSSELARIRTAAEPFKSFPKAVALCVRYLFDRGATDVRIEHKVRPHSEVHLVVNGVKALLSPEDMDELDRQSLALNEGVGFVFVHHACSLGVSYQEFGWDFRLRNRSGWFTTLASTEDVQIVFNSLGEGEGVNARQDRSAKRLIRELPRLLSPREAFYTSVIDENGKAYPLAKSLFNVSVNGLRISWPEKMIGFGRKGLTLKFGAVRCDMGRFIAAVLPEEAWFVSCLNHPWLCGTVEVHVDDYPDTPVPTTACDDFGPNFYSAGHARRLAEALRGILPKVLQEWINKEVADAISDFTNREGVIVLDGYGYRLGFFGKFPKDHSLVVCKDVSTGVDVAGTTAMLVDPFHPVFSTIGPDRDEIMQVIWWQLAMWIEGNVPDVFTGASNPQERTTKIYLALREQNPERWDD